MIFFKMIENAFPSLSELNVIFKSNKLNVIPNQIIYTTDDRIAMSWYNAIIITFKMGSFGWIHT